MNRIWSLLFLLVPILGMTAFVWAACGSAPLQAAWLPESLGANAPVVDGLFRLVHWICAVFFVGIGLTIATFIWLFASPKRKRAVHIHSNTQLEILWSVVPGLILVFIAVHQLQTWSSEKLERPMVEVDGRTVPRPAIVRVVAKQFGWEFYYAGRDGVFDTVDDFFVENLMLVPDDEPVVIQLHSRDVIHSFFVPQLRLKQDIVPGMRQIAWFKPIRAATMSILCAELCGWGHYRMNALLKVVPRAEYDAWIRIQQDRFDPPELATSLELSRNRVLCRHRRAGGENKDVCRHPQVLNRHPRAGGDPEKRCWVPACAGMTSGRYSPAYAGVRLGAGMTSGSLFGTNLLDSPL